MPEPTIQFCFENQEAASNAFETLDELGYRPERIGDGRTVKVYVNRADLTSALEIAQAFGGELCGQDDRSVATWDDAYNMQDSILYDGFVPDNEYQP